MNVLSNSRYTPDLRGFIEFLEAEHPEHVVSITKQVDPKFGVSGILERLKVLDLRHGCIGDEGARTLARCKDVRRLELLSLADNELTEAGCELLRGLGINVRLENQHEPGSNQYLWSGDME